jgi:hypothetical protein
LASGRVAGPGPNAPPSGGETGSSIASSGCPNPGWNHTPPGRFIDPVTIISAQASHCVTLAPAAIVTPVPVSTATGPARRTAASSVARSSWGTSAIRAVRSMVNGATARARTSLPTVCGSSTVRSAPLVSSSRTRKASTAWSVPGRGARWCVARRAVSVRRGSTTQTSARSRSPRSVFTGSGMATVWPCDTTGLQPTYITNVARS